MNILDIITKKKDGLALTDAEIGFFVDGVCDGSLPDYQISALLMAICLKGMDENETVALTHAMAQSGETADLSAIEGITVDKHSSGGVADLTTLAALPLAAACGVKCAKMSGRGLGHTGGTLDKLDAIPGMRTGLTMQEYIAQIRRIGCALIGQTGDFAPADKKLYALRDVTATVQSMPLIVSSILSKKLAAGCDAIVLDVKAGSGAFMQTPQAARELAAEMVKIGKKAGRRVVAYVTDMQEPLGHAVGNALEVKEAVAMLRGQEQGRALSLVTEIASAMVSVGLSLPMEQARARVAQALSSGAGFAKLKEMVAAQGGDIRVLEEPSLLPGAAVEHEIRFAKGGFVTGMDCMGIGLAGRDLGAGRLRAEDTLDLGVGIDMRCRIGDAVKAGDVLAVVYAKTQKDALACEEKMLSAVRVGEQAPAQRPLIYERIE